jgi:hypothetical protein
MQQSSKEDLSITCKEMKQKQTLFIVLTGLVLLAMVPWLPKAMAQTQVAGWSAPFLLSTNGRKASDASLVADQYGYAHIFWTETLADERVIIQYARYEGSGWPTPMDIYVTQPFKTIGNISPAVDRSGILHMVWSEGLNGPAYYTSAPSATATSVQQWQPRRMLKIPANRIELQVDSKGVLHILYIKLLSPEAGVYYIRSEDEGISWWTRIFCLAMAQGH